MRRGIVLASVVLFVSAAPAGVSKTETRKPKDRGLVRVAIKRPAERKTVRHLHWRPWGTPSVARVRRIIRIEARRWGAPAWRLDCRVRGESTYRWWEANGQYHGVGQFAYSTFTRGLSTIRSRVAVMIDYRWRTRRERITYFYDDGSRERRKGRRVRQRVRHVYVGKIPRPTPWLHAWAQIRIMAQAMVGRSAVHDSEWSVRC